MAGSVVAQGQRGTFRACAIVAAAEQQIESLADAILFQNHKCDYDHDRNGREQKSPSGIGTETERLLSDEGQKVYQ
jgi:hypothetical protein